MFLDLSKVLLLLALLYTKPFDLGYNLLGFARGSEFFGLILRLADIALFVALCVITLPFWDYFKNQTVNLRKFAIYSGSVLGLIFYWISINLNTFHSFKTGFLVLLAVVFSGILCFKYNPKWMLVLIPYFCFDHILVTSPAAVSIFLLLGLLAHDLDKTLNKTKEVTKSGLIALFLIIIVNLAVGIYQVATGHSLGLSWLGEANLSLSSTDGIAKQILPFSNQIVLRGYGLMPHPNILGFLGIFGFLISSSGFDISKIGKNVGQKFGQNPELFKLANVIASLALITVSMSRMAFIAILIYICLTIALQAKNKSNQFVDQVSLQKYLNNLRFFPKTMFLIVPILFVLLFFSLATRSTSDTYRLRQHTTLQSFIHQKPQSLLLGVGPGQYPNQLQATQITQNTWENEPFYQPFGNLLIELGLVGLFLLIIICPKLYQIL